MEAAEVTDESGANGGLESRLIGESSCFLGILATLRRYSACDAPVLIEGETGTGKELVARALHYLSERKGGPFIPVNCAALPCDLVVNELFGHERGAFTGADKRRSGLVEEARGGTIFLDEVDTLPLAAQGVLLRFLQDQEYRPLGGGARRTGDVRVLAASNAGMDACVCERSFREDLFYRLNVLTLSLPPLRERREDIRPLAAHFLSGFQARYRRPAKSLTSCAFAAMCRYRWPGNVRELENRLHRAFLVTASVEIDAADLGLPPGEEPHGIEETVSDGALLDGSFAAAKARAVAEFERAYLCRLMEAAQGNISAASRMAKKERRALARLLKKHGIDRRRFRPDCRE